MNNENYEAQELDELIESISQWILEDEMKPGILNPPRVQQMRFSHSVMKRLTTGSAMQVTYTMHDPFPSMGSITVEGDHLAFSDCKWLGRALEFASNVEVYPLSNGGVRMVLTFHGLVKRA